MSFENGPSYNNPEAVGSDSADESLDPELQYEQYDSDTEEYEFGSNEERRIGAIGNLGSLSLEQTVELQQEEPETAELSPEESEPTDEIESGYGDYEVEDEDEDEKPAWLTDDELEEYEEFKKFKKSSSWKKQTLGDESTRKAALEFVYLTTGMPVDEIN